MDLLQDFFGRGWGEGFLVFLQGGLGKGRVWMWCFSGEFAVRCVVNVVFWQELFEA